MKNMDSLLHKILPLPVDLIREIAGYFILKIPKNDPRYQKLLGLKPWHEEFYVNGDLRCKWFEPAPHLQLSFHLFLAPIYSRGFVEYVFINFTTMKQSNFRFMADGTYKEAIDGRFIYYT
jgi:hypothetical protein